MNCSGTLAQKQSPAKPAAARGRLAPSPTGRLHLGNAFAFLMAWLSVRSRNGVLVLRMEDIDPERSRPEHAQGILRDLDWLGLTWDEGPDRGGSRGPYAQSERLESYAGLLEKLNGRGLVYPCYCSRKELRLLASAPHVGDEGVPYPGTCKSLDAADRAALERSGKRPCLRIDAKAAAKQAAGALRHNEDGAALPHRAGGPGLTDFTDGVLGEQGFSLSDCGGDFALCRSDGVFAYQLAVAADDAAMGITEVIRGDDLLLSTPRQLLLFALMRKPPPAYAHVPLLHDAAGERLAKRHHALELAALREAGIAPEAVIGYLGRLAGFAGCPKRASPRELLPCFSLAALQGRRLQVPADITDRLR